MSELTAEPRPDNPFPAEDARKASPAPAVDPLDGDWSDGLRSAVRAFGIPLPRLLTDTSEAPALRAATPVHAVPADDSVEAPDAWAAAGEDPLHPREGAAPPVVELRAEDAEPEAQAALREQSGLDGSVAAVRPEAIEAAPAGPSPVPGVEAAASAPLALPDGAGEQEGVVALSATSALEAHTSETIVELSAAEALDSGVEEAPQEVVELQASEALAANEPAAARRKVQRLAGAEVAETSDSNAWASAIVTTLPGERTDGGTPWSGPVAAAPAPAEPWHAPPIALPASARPSVQPDGATAGSSPGYPPSDGTWAGATPADAHPAWGALAPAQAAHADPPPADERRSSAQSWTPPAATHGETPADLHPAWTAPATVSSDTPADPHPAWTAPAEVAAPHWSAAAPEADWQQPQQPAAAPAWGAAAPAADWGAVSSGPDWSAAPAAAAGSVPHDGWGAPPPAAAESGWSMKPAPSPQAEWTAPPAEPPAKPTWNTPGAGASTYDQLDAPPDVEVSKDAQSALFAPLQHGESLSGDDEPTVYIEEDPDLPVAVIEEELEPAPLDAILEEPAQAAAPLGHMQTVAVGSLAVVGEHRVAVHTRGGRTRRGVVKDIDLAKSQFGLQPQGGGADEAVYHAEVKAIFFMMSPGEKPRAGQGSKVRITFADGRTIDGQRDGGEGKHGFFLVPADAARTNTRRIYVAREAAAEIVDS